MEGLAVNRSIPIGIQEWIRLSCHLHSRHSVVENAVNLAYMLTKCIGQMDALSAGVNLEDYITTENIIILIKRPSSTAQCITNAPIITEAKFQFEPIGVLSPLQHVPSQDDISATPSSSGPVCAALGKVLLEIFSMGRSSSLENFNGAANTNDLESIQNSQGRLPARKRQATMSPSGGLLISSATARKLLLELGMPLSICQLVCDLLDAGNESSSHQVSRTLVSDVYWDLTQMKTRTESFLFDRTCPLKAMADTCLFERTDTQLFGRDEEMKALMMTRKNVSEFVQNQEEDNDSAPAQGSNFLCETVFLHGLAGSGKSSILHSLTNFCNAEDWFVLGCKFDKHAAPHVTFAKAFDDFFAKWGAANIGTDATLNPSMIKSFREVCTCILETVDNEGFDQLRDLMPNFTRMFPILSSRSNNREKDRISSMDKVGSANTRRNYMFHILLKALCSTGRSVLLSLDDLQWSQAFVMETVADFVVNFADTHDGPRVSGRTDRRGLLIASAFRSNEVKEGDDIAKSINCIKQSGKANVTMLAVGALSKIDVNRLVSAKLCLPWRHTRELAELVHSKTAKGNLFFVIQFLRSIIQNKMLEFSVKYRQWRWDCDVVDMQMISNDVAKLLTTTFSKLPFHLMQTISIVSCLGTQVEESTIIALNSRGEILPFDMLNELEHAVKEGIMEKAGPMYQFTHDIIHQTVYNLTPSDDLRTLHKSIGNGLLQSAMKNPTIHLIAVDQINIFCKDGSLSLEECAQYAHANATAAESAIESCSFEKARSYINIGIQLLNAEHWQTQYSLSLNLFEMSASLSCISGDVTKLSSCLSEILSHARTFNDSLKASSLLVKLLASASKFDDARNNCLVILSHYGEVFPSEISLPHALGELSTVRTALGNISHSRVKLLPKMVDKGKLNAMKFLNMLCMHSIISKPMLLPFLSCRMVEITLVYGFCDDSIVGFATAGYSEFIFTENLQLASHIRKVTESLVEESPNKHALRARLCVEMATSMLTEPIPSVLAHWSDLYNSAMMAGDVANAGLCRLHYCIGGFWACLFDLVTVARHFGQCIQEAGKYQQNTVLYSMMANFNAVTHLSGITSDSAVIKSYDELDEIGEHTSSYTLVWQTFMCRVSYHFWMREYLDVATLSQKYSEKHSSSDQKRILGIFRVFLEGISYLSLARDTKQAKWRSMGEDAVVKMSQLESMSTWNYKNKATLLQAELLYLNGDIGLAEVAYKVSIKSAHEHKLIHEEALAYELYGMCCVENHWVVRGLENLQLALKTYEQWGARNKVDELQLFIDTLSSE